MVNNHEVRSRGTETELPEIKGNHSSRKSEVVSEWIRFPRGDTVWNDSSVQNGMVQNKTTKVQNGMVQCQCGMLWCIGKYGGR